MNDEEFNMSMRKFLKQVGVTSQKAIEDAVRAGHSGGDIQLKMVLTSEDIALEHSVTGVIKTGDAS